MRGLLTLRPGLSALESDPTRMLQALRERVLHTFVVWLSWTAVPIGALVLLQSAQGRYLTKFVWFFVVVSQLGMVIRLFLGRLGYKTTVVVFLTWLQLLIFYTHMMRGLTAGSALLQVVFVLMATMLFGVRGTVGALLACSAVLALSAAVMMNGLVTPMDPALWNPLLGLVWLRYGVVFLTLGGTIAWVFARMIEQLQLQLVALHRSLEGEREERKRRDAVQLELERSQRFETLALLAAGIAHDLNNTLGVVMGSAELIQTHEQSPDSVRQLAGDILTAAEGSTDTVRQLLTLGRRDEVRAERVNLRDCFSRLAAPFSRVLNPGTSARVNIVRMNIAPDCEVSIDLSRLQRVLLNLTVNARDAMPEGGELRIDVSRIAASATTAALVRIDFADTGTGMDEATRARIFEPFFTTKGPGKGTGLGLAMVQTVMQDAGGHVEVESALGHGTTISLFLPSLLPAELVAPEIMRLEV